MHCNPDDPDEVIAMEHKIKGFKYGKNYVPITTEDMDMMKLPTIGGVTIMHFLPQSAVPRQYFMAGPVMMDPQPDNAVAATAMAALHQVLASTNQVGIVRVVKKDNAEPFLGCMQPTGPSTGTGAGLGTGFIIQRLPFSEDVRAYIFPSLNPYRVGEQRVKLQQTVSTFVDSMTYAKINTSAIVTFNPVLQTVIHELQHKALFGADNSSSSSDPTDSAKMAPLPDIVLIKPAVARKPVINQLLAQISQECSLEVQEKKEKKRKVYWDEIKVKPAAGEGADGASSSADDLSRTSSVSSLDSDVANLRMLMINSQTADSRAPAAGGGAGAGEGYKYRVLSRDNATNPAESLLQLLEGNTSENIIASVETMQGVIFDLIMVGATGAHCKKAVQCVKSMRAAAIHLGTIAAVTSYHAYLQSIKTTFKGAAGSRSKFWDLFSQEYMNNPENTECVSIIQSECKHSTLTGTAAEANARYFGEEAGDETAAVGPTQTEEVEEEDMFGDMM